MIPPIFLKFKRFKGLVPAGFEAEFTGAMISIDFVEGWNLPERQQDRYAEPGYPLGNEDLFGYISFLEAIDNAKNTFTMIELGAGYGRWLVSAAKAAEQRENLNVFLIGVEAEPAHFSMMKQHFRNNGLDPAKHLLIKAAITDHENTVFFLTGDPNACWGQTIMRYKKPYKAWIKWLLSVVKKNDADKTHRKVKPVKGISLKTILADLQLVDHMDLDIQGEEYKVLNYAKEQLDKKVRSLHIGTHGRGIEENLRKLFSGLGWTCQYDFPGNAVVETPYGKVPLQDGVQVWKNDKLLSV